MTNISLGTIDFNNGVADANGALWYVTGWDGWDSPSQRQGFEEPTTRHGGVVTESLLGTRSVVLNGVCKAPNSAAFWAAYNRLLQVTAVLKTPISLVVTEDVQKTLFVVRGGQVRQRMIGNSAFEFEIPLIAQDPLKYGAVTGATAIAAAGTQVLTNSGTFQTQRITVTLTSGGTVKLVNNATSQTFSTGDTVAASGTVYDFYARTALSGTTNRYHEIAASSQWWGLEAGSNTIDNDGTAAVSITYRPAWV